MKTKEGGHLFASFAVGDGVLNLGSISTSVLLEQ